MSDDEGKPQSEQISDEHASTLTVEFGGIDSTAFGYSRQNVNAWQLIAPAKTLQLIGELEIQRWHINSVANSESKKPRIVVPGAH